MEMTTLFKEIAESLDLWCKVEDERYCSLVDVDEEIYLSIECFDGGPYEIWTCQAVVCDLHEQQLSPADLLMKNDSGLVWCYYALKSREDEEGAHRTSLNLKYSFATPPDDHEFAFGLLVTVLARMRDFVIETRPV